MELNSILHIKNSGFEISMCAMMPDWWLAVVQSSVKQGGFRFLTVNCQLVSVSLYLSIWKNKFAPCNRCRCWIVGFRTRRNAC